MKPPCLGFFPALALGNSSPWLSPPLANAPLISPETGPGVDLSCTILSAMIVPRLLGGITAGSGGRSGLGPPRGRQIVALAPARLIAGAAGFRAPRPGAAHRRRPAAGGRGGRSRAGGA